MEDVVDLTKDTARHVSSRTVIKLGRVCLRRPAESPEAAGEAGSPAPGGPVSFRVAGSPFKSAKRGPALSPARAGGGSPVRSAGQLLSLLEDGSPPGSPEGGRQVPASRGSPPESTPPAPATTPAFAPFKSAKRPAPEAPPLRSMSATRPPPEERKKAKRRALEHDLLVVRAQQRVVEKQKQALEREAAAGCDGEVVVGEEVTAEDRHNLALAKGEVIVLDSDSDDSS